MRVTAGPAPRSMAASSTVVSLTTGLSQAVGWQGFWSPPDYVSATSRFPGFRRLESPGRTLMERPGGWSPGTRKECVMAVPTRITVRDLARCKTENRRFAMLTAYDFPTARLLDEAGIPVLLVGDSLGQVVLGYDTTLPVTMDEMLHHCRAVARGARNALLIGDMPSGSYQVSLEEGIRN